jgi:Tfp pilus assembly protein PilF
MALSWILMIEEGHKHVPNAKFRNEDPKVQKAEEYSLRAIFAEPKYDSFSLFRYAQLLEKCGKLHSAEDYYLMALEADPNNAGCLHCYGSFLSERGLHEEAEEFFKRASQNTIGLKQWPQWYH